MTIDTATAKDKLAADFRNVMSDIDALLNATGREAVEEAASLRERIQAKLDDAKHRVSDLQHEAAYRAKRAAGATDDYVHDHPWQAVGVAAALGLAIGVLISRR
ncbi:DUF883 family protein [Ideonella sp.]|uniref:DUF883 family protein n=1 Tax=Ideonella sp. TaxID=1929293 RepID=UPI003BB5EE1D